MKRIVQYLAGVALLAVALFLAPTFLAGMAGQQYGVAYAVGTGVTGAQAAGAVASPSADPVEGIALGGSGVAQGMFGSGVLQPTNPSQAAPTIALGQSAIVIYSSTQTPAAVNAGLTAEQDFTVTGILAGSVVFFSKPAAQAGLGVCSARVKAADTVSVTYTNPTAGNLTPTAAQADLIVEVRGPLVQSAVLTFSAAVGSGVAAHTTREYLFTLTPAAGSQGVSSAQHASVNSGPSIGSPSSVSPTTTQPSVLFPATGRTSKPVLTGAPQTVLLNKPTAQAGMGLANVRVVGNNQIGIAFQNSTAAEVIPTSGETYTFFACRGVALRANIIRYRVVTGVVAAVAQGTSAERDITVTGLAVGDAIAYVNKPTLQAGLSIGNARVKAANTLSITYVNTPNAGGNITPTNEVYEVGVDKAYTGKGAILTQFTAVITPVAVAAITSAEQTFTVPGLVAAAPIGGFNAAACDVGDTFLTTLGRALPTGLAIGGVRVSATNTLAIVFVNQTAASITPGTLMLTVLTAPADISDGGAGSCVAYPLDNNGVQNSENDNAITVALLDLGVIRGS